MKTAGDLDEFALIDRVSRRAAGAMAGKRAVTFGIGDDAALLRAPRGTDTAVSTDAHIEGVHFRFETQSAVAIGQRALVASLSDLAAMGARPLAFVWALTLRPDLPLRALDGLATGVARAAEQYACPLVGGNLSRARDVSLTMTVLGAVQHRRALRRDAARPGDRLFVTGSLGASALALAAAENKGIRTRWMPVPRLDAGRALARRRSRGACIDLSDGLIADLGHLLAASAARCGRPLGAQIDRDRIPAAGGLVARAKRLGLDAERLILAGGEDYELLFSLRQAASLASLRRALGVPVAEIGRVIQGTGISISGRSGSAESKGWRHFGSP